MKFALDSYAARSCPVKTFNAFSPDLTRPPDESDQQLSAVFHRSREHRRDIVERLRNNPQVLDMATVDDRQAATLDAMSRGVVAILNPRLPTDWENHRSGHPDLLVHDGKSGYCPVRIKPYLVLETQTGNRELQVSGLSDLTKRSVLQSRRYRSKRESSLLELAHHWRLLEACGFAADHPSGGVVGADFPAAGFDQPQVIWVSLDRRFIRTFARTAIGNHRMRSPLERYDHEHSFRVHVAEQASSSRTGEPPVRPIRIRECDYCPWWEVCRPQMADDDISLRISKAPLDVRELEALKSLGITTTKQLADADIEATLVEYLPLATHRDHSELRLRQAARRAQMLETGSVLERTTTGPIDIPRSEVEIDLDIETDASGMTYLWGALLTNRSTGHQQFHHFSKFADLTDDEEVELAADFARWLLDQFRQHPDLKVFHYSDYETVQLHRLAQRSEQPDLLAVTEGVSEHFVDLFRYVRENLIGVEGLGLKVVASEGAGFHWRDPEPGGLASQSWFDEAISAADRAVRERAAQRVLDYNEDDVRATWALREWLTKSS